VWCSLWGTDWILKCYLDELRLQRLKFCIRVWCEDITGIHLSQGRELVSFREHNSRCYTSLLWECVWEGGGVFCELSLFLSVYTFWLFSFSTFISLSCTMYVACFFKYNIILDLHNLHLPSQLHFFIVIVHFPPLFPNESVPKGFLYHNSACILTSHNHRQSGSWVSPPKSTK
jgi:hypothetical protein